MALRARKASGAFEKRALGPSCSNPDYANQGLAKILISFSQLSARSSVYIFSCSVLSMSNLKRDKTQGMDNTFIQEKLLHLLTTCFGVSCRCFFLRVSPYFDEPVLKFTTHLSSLGIIYTSWVPVLLYITAGETFFLPSPVNVKLYTIVS